MSKASNATTLSSFEYNPIIDFHNGISGTLEVNTFFITEVLVTKLKDWNTIPIPRLNLRNSFPFKLLTSCPFTVNTPSVISCILFTVLSKVDLPAPDKPIIATNSPCCISKFIFFNALLSP